MADAAFVTQSVALRDVSPSDSLFRTSEALRMENNVDVDPAVLHVPEGASHLFVSYDSAGSAW